MLSSQELREDTRLMDANFPFNIFLNRPDGYNVLGLHWHESIEIIYMIKGHAIFNIGTMEIPGLPGDIIFVNSGLLHSGYSVDNTSVEYYAIVINKAMLGSQSPDPYYLKYINPFLSAEHPLPPKVTAVDTAYKDIIAAMDSIIKEFYNKLPGYEMAVKSHLILLLVSIFRHYSDASLMDIRQEKFTRDIGRFRELFVYIEKHFSKRITVDDAASVVNLSPHHFCKTFKKITGRTFVDFLNLYRVNAAEEMLRKTSLPITEISEKVGFCNINYFDKTFKQYKRYSPSKCRKF